jgi:hypothetical protein
VLRKEYEKILERNAKHRLQRMLPKKWLWRYSVAAGQTVVGKVTVTPLQSYITGFFEVTSSVFITF